MQYRTLYRLIMAVSVVLQLASICRGLQRINKHRYDEK